MFSVVLKCAELKNNDIHFTGMAYLFSFFLKPVNSIAVYCIQIPVHILRSVKVHQRQIHAANKRCQSVKKTWIKLLLNNKNERWTIEPSL